MAEGADNYMLRQKHFIVEVKKKHEEQRHGSQESKGRDSKYYGASINRYEIRIDGHIQTRYNGKIVYEHGKERNVCFQTFNDEATANKVFSATYDLHHEAIVKAWFVTYCVPIRSWIVCYDHFDCSLHDWVTKEDTQAMIRDDDLLTDFGSERILLLINGIRYLHECGHAHGGLDNHVNYVVSSKKVKIINIGTGDVIDDTTRDTLMMVDLEGLKTMLEDHLLHSRESWVERDVFLKFFELTAIVRYNIFIEKLLEHSFFMTTPLKRMESFFEILHAFETDLMVNPDSFCTNLETLTEYKNWVDKMGPDLDNIHSKFPNDSSTEVVKHLLDVLRNAYRHPGGSTYERLDKEVRERYPGFLHSIHHVACWSTVVEIQEEEIDAES